MNRNSNPIALLSLILVCLSSLCSAATPTPEQRLAKRLEWFQDQKFGLFLHWGPYSQLGVDASWPIIWTDRSRFNPGLQSKEEMERFREKYGALPTTFNPTAFDPKLWAQIAKRAGMRYVVLTTKHHDGFNMYDTKLSDYRITAPAVPFSKDPRANITARLFDAFRAAGLGIGAYYSKADWHSPDYWRSGTWPEDRNPNYDTAAEPERWKSFVSFVHGQIRELMSNYGRIDILWMDAGWVSPPKQDLQMDKLAAIARGLQPDLIMVNRTAGDRYENYYTPEQTVPERPLDHVWESCVTMGTQWGYKPDDQYKSTHELLHLLIGIVAKGGNLLLNVGPAPDGSLPPVAVSRLSEIGEWMKVNGEAIHGTRAIAPYRAGSLAFTQKGRFVYAIYLTGENESALPARIEITSIHPARGSRIQLLGSAAKLRWSTEGDVTVVEMPESVRKAPPSRHAFTLKIRTSTGSSVTPTRP